MSPKKSLSPLCLLRKALHIIYKSFVRLHLDYGDIFYNKSEIKNLKAKLERFNTKLVLQ